LALCRSYSEIFDVQKVLRPLIPGKGSIKVNESAIIRWIGYGFLLAFYSNFLPKIFDL